MIIIKWNAKAERMLQNFCNSKTHWESFLEQSCYELGEDSIHYIKENGYLKAHAPFFGIVKGTGELENSLEFEVKSSGGGFAVNFYGLFYGNYIEKGNGSSRIYPKGGKYLAVRSKVENSYPMRSVAPMGKSMYSNWKPIPFSTYTANYISDHAHELLDKYLQETLERLVSV